MHFVQFPQNFESVNVCAETVNVRAETVNVGTHICFLKHIWVFSQNPYLGFETPMYFLKCTFVLCMENQILVFVSQSKYGFQNPHMGFKTHIYVLKLDFCF